eukprot:427691-Prorocentrum_minimum.AAC.1
MFRSIKGPWRRRRVQPRFGFKLALCCAHRLQASAELKAARTTSDAKDADDEASSPRQRYLAELKELELTALRKSQKEKETQLRNLQQELAALAKEQHKLKQSLHELSDKTKNTRSAFLRPSLFKQKYPVQLSGWGAAACGVMPLCSPIASSGGHHKPSAEGTTVILEDSCGLPGAQDDTILYDDID